MKERKKLRLLKEKEYRKLKRENKREFKEKLNKWKDKVIIRDKVTCQKCGKRLGILKNTKRPHHIISLQNVKRKYSELLTDINNGILLCQFCHKWAPNSAHQGGFEFYNWFKNKFPERYEYLLSQLKDDTKNIKKNN